MPAMAASGQILSMSGYGRGSAQSHGLRVTCEIRTVNHRYLDLVVSLPAGMLERESVLRKWISQTLSRGRVEVSVALAAGNGSVVPVLDERLARWYAGKLLKIAKAMHLSPPGVEAVAQLPGVITRPVTVPEPHRTFPLLRRATARALKSVRSMRRREGAALAADLLRRIRLVERSVGWLDAEWPRYRERHLERNRARLQAALERIGEEKKSGPLKEMLGILERGDIVEELTRLRSHLAQFRAALRRGGATGRKFDFLTQEIQREVHTIGAKTFDARIARRVLELKEELERIREQVQNLE